MEAFDIIIAGGGLAGGAAGILFGKRGLKVRILEKAGFPRHKVCGEFLSPAVQPLLESIGVSTLVHSAGVKRIEAVSLFWPNQKPVHARISPVPAYGLSRQSLDSLMLAAGERQGCAVGRNEEVIAVDPHEEAPYFFHVHTRDTDFRNQHYRAKLVFDARGRNHVPDRKGGGLPLAHRFFGFKAHFKNLPVGSATELFFFQGGYLGLLEIEGGFTNLCGKVDEKTLRACGGNFDHLIKKIGGENSIFGLRMHRAVREIPWLACGPLKEGFRQGYRAGIFYLGDAACFVEPFLGQGMTLAMAGACLLDSVMEIIPSTKEALEKAGTVYERKLRKLYASKLQNGRWLGPFSFHPAWGSSLARLFSAFPFIFPQIVKNTCSVRAARPRTLAQTAKARMTNGLQTVK